MRAAIMGTGSIGTVLGALITQKGGQIDLIDSNETHVKVLNDRGATIVGGKNFTIPVKAYTPDQLTGIYDLIILLCKQTATKEALEQLLPHLDKNSVVCTLQNGIPEETVAKYIGRERTMGGVVVFGATWKEPGVSECTSDENHMNSGVIVEIGEISGEITPRLLEVQKLLSHAGCCDISENLMGLRWTKVLINATASGMSAALGCDYGGVLDSELAMYALARIGDETVKVAHGCGYKLVSIDGNDFEEREIIGNQSPMDKLPFYHEFWGKKHRALKASMLQDLEKGYPTEIDFINGHVCSWGRKVGIPTPYNDLVMAIVKAAEANKVVIRKEEGLRFFQILFNAIEK